MCEFIPLKTYLGRTFGILLLVVALYLAVVWVWATLSVQEAVAKFPQPGNDGALAPWQKAALFQVEDPFFYQHHGVSVGRGQGLTTISSSLAREVFLLHGRLDGGRGGVQRFYRSVFECCKQIDLGRDVMAVVLDRHLSKDQQLAMYVSTVYMGAVQGRQISGLPSAAQVYWNKPLQQLNQQEFYGLLAMIKAPNFYSPSRNPAAYERRLGRISALLHGDCQPSGWFDTDYAECNR